MADISTRMSVSGLSEYKSAMQQAAQSVKTLDAQLKKADAEFKATGDKEKYMADKAKILEDRLKAQKSAAKNAEQAMKLLKQNGDTTSTAYQKLAQQLAQAETGILETNAALNQLGQTELEAAKGADQLTASVNGISKKISLEQVIGGINKITDGLETAARKAAELGKAIWSEITEQAAKADEIATKATMYDMTAEQYQAIAKVAATWGDTSVEAIMKARQRVQSKISDIAGDLMGIGVSPTYKIQGKDEATEVWRDWEDIFWEAGEALMNMTDQYDRAEKAQAIFGRRWEELKPMFAMGREEYKKTVDAQIVADNESIAKLEALNNTIITLQSDFESLEQEVLAGMAPALTKGAEVLDDLLGKLMDYLKTEQGQQMLERMETAISGLFEDLANIDPESVVNNFVAMFDKLVESFEWITKNWSSVENGLKAIVGVWAGGKVASGALTIIQMLNGLKGLTGGGAGSAGQIALSLGGKLAFNGIESTLGTSIGRAVASALTSTPLTVAIAAASIIAIAHGVHEAFTATTITDKVEESLIESGNTQEEAKAKAEAMEQAAQKDFWTNPSGRKNAMDLLKKGLTTNDWTVEPVPVAVEPKTDEQAAAEISAQIGTVSVPVKLVIQGGNGAVSYGGGASGGGGLKDYYWETTWGGFRPGFANGLPFVPFDGYPAILHRGEQVVPAREVSNRSYSSNLYIENMNMNNGQDAEGLAARIAAANRRTMSGFGS